MSKDSKFQFIKWLTAPLTPEEGTPMMSDEESIKEAVRIARTSIRLAFIVIITALVYMLSSFYITNAKNIVVAIPTGDIWEYPMVHWTNSPDRYEEDAKPMHVAIEYVHGLYEADPLDFSSPDPLTPALTQVKMSDRINSLLAYTIPDTDEHKKVINALNDSQALYQRFAGCKCVKRFLISDILVSSPPLPMLRIEMIGRFVIFGQDGRRPLEAEDLGIKSIVLYMSHDAPIYDRNHSNGNEGISIRPLNPEGWFVVRSAISTLSQKDLEDVRKIREEIGMKNAL